MKSRELSTELSAKRLEILKEAVPNLRRVAMLWNAADHGMTLRYRAAQSAAQILGVSVQPLGVREPNDFDDAFAEMTKSRPDAILMVSDALTTLNRKRVIEFASTNGLPAIYEFRPLVRELVINLNTAKALGLTLPPTLLARADEVIE
jgi:putative ABC transport system substrate-binding protein